MAGCASVYVSRWIDEGLMRTILPDEFTLHLPISLIMRSTLNSYIFSRHEKRFIGRLLACIFSQRQNMPPRHK